jgi:hypothetical protein
LYVPLEKAAMRLLPAVVLAPLLTAVFLAAPVAATAADLAVQPVRTKAVVHHVKRHKLVRMVRAHRGYYFYQWGWRYGPSGRNWLGSRFQLAGWSPTPPWAPAYSEPWTW